MKLVNLDGQYVDVSNYKQLTTEELTMNMEFQKANISRIKREKIYQAIPDEKILAKIHSLQRVGKDFTEIKILRVFSMDACSGFHNFKTLFKEQLNKIHETKKIIKMLNRERLDRKKKKI